MNEDLTTLQAQISKLTQQLQTVTYRLNTHKHNRSDLTQQIAPVPPVMLTDGASIQTDASGGNHFSITLTGNHTLANPTGATDGQKIIFEIIQDSTGSRTISFDTKFAFGTGISSITLTTTANKRDFIGVIYRANTDKFYVVAFANGY